MSAVRTGFARTDDGLELYYRVVGEGPPLVCCNGVGVSTFFWKYIVAHFRDRYRVVVWDYRGHGLSAMPTDLRRTELGMERNADDLLTVLDAADIREPAVLLGHSMGCQVILEFHRRHPERTRALIPMFGTFARPLDTFMDNPRSRDIFRIVRRVARLGGRSGTRLMLPLYAGPLAFPFSKVTGLIDKYYAGYSDMRKYNEHLVHMDPQIFLEMVGRMADHDLTEHLAHVRVPTLVVAGEKDLFTPLHRSEEMARRIPDAEIMILPEASHAAIIEYPDAINRRIDRFLSEHRLAS